MDSAELQRFVEGHETQTLEIKENILKPSYADWQDAKLAAVVQPGQLGLDEDAEEP